jgi:hypothetical protein
MMDVIFERMHRRRRMLRPDVTITNATSLRGLLCGYEKLVLRDAVMRMGARTCRWGAGCDWARTARGPHRAPSSHAHGARPTSFSSRRATTMRCTSSGPS